MPRKYTLGKRARAVARTRARIIEAAMALYAEQPVRATSMQAVAHRADVAPGTVLNHFATSDDLARAVVIHLVTHLRAPSEAIFEGAETTPERVARLARELAGFFERSAPWFHVHERERDAVPAFAEGAKRFDDRVRKLIARVLGPLAGDERAELALRALLGAPVLRGLVVHGRMSPDEAAALVTEILVPWLEARAVAGDASSSASSTGS